MGASKGTQRRPATETSRLSVLDFLCQASTGRAPGARGTRDFPLALPITGPTVATDSSNGLPGVIHHWILPLRFTSKEFTVLVLAGIEGPDSPEGSGPIRDGVSGFVRQFFPRGSRELLGSGRRIGFKVEPGCFG